MAFPTVNVTGTIADAQTNPIEGAKVSARLTNVEAVPEAYVVPSVISTTTDVNGDFTLALWPNELGNTASMYEVVISTPDGSKRETVLATIPNTDCVLFDVANLPAYPGKSDGQIAVDAAVAAVALTAADVLQTAADVVTTNNNVTTTNGHVTTTNNNVTAAQTAQTAAEAAQAAAESAQTAASLNETASAANEAKAQLWAEELENVEVEPGKFSAFHWAQKAGAIATGQLIYQGAWDASSGVYPSSPSTGHYYKVTTAGTISGTVYAVGDSFIYNGAGWDKIDNTEQVTSVGGYIGAISAAQLKAAYEAEPDTNAFTDGYKSYLDSNSGFASIAVGSTLDVNNIQAGQVDGAGGTTITRLSDKGIGAVVYLVMGNVNFTFVHDSTNLKLPGNANIVTQQFDRAIFMQHGNNLNGQWTCIHYSRADGKSVIPRGTFVTNSSGNPNMSDVPHTGYVVNSWRSVGPTGAGKNYTWTALDSVPDDVDWIEVKIALFCSDGPANSYLINRLYARLEGSGVGISDQNLIACASARSDGGGLCSNDSVSSAKIKVSSKVFEIYIASSFTYKNLNITLIGYGYN